MNRRRPLCASIVTVILAACSSTADGGAPAELPALPDREAADRVLATMRAKINAAEELVQLRDASVRELETAVEAGAESSLQLATARAESLDARIRSLNYRQELYIAEGAMPLILETMRQKVIAAEQVVEIREAALGEAEAMHRAGRAGRPGEVRGQLLEDRIRLLNYRQELYTAEAMLGFTRSTEDGN